MPDLSSIIPETHQNISYGFLEVLIQEHRQELFSGLMRISYPSGENLIFVFLDGVQQNLYRWVESATQIVDRQDWPHLLNRPGASVGFLPLGVDGLRLMRVIYESPVLLAEQASLSHSDLIERVNAWIEAPEPGFVYLQSGKTHRIHGFIGNPNPIVEELSITDGQAKFSIGDITFPQNLPDTDYKTAHYLGAADHDVWREYKLRLAFHPLMRMLITRFGELAGRVLAERLGAQLTDWASTGGWNMSINSNGVVNRQYFDSLEEAVNVYVSILRQFRDEAGLAVGPRLVENMFRETFAKLPPNFRDVVDQHIYGQFGPGSAALFAQKESIRL